MYFCGGVPVCGEECATMCISVCVSIPEKDFVGGPEGGGGGGKYVFHWRCTYVWGGVCNYVRKCLCL